MATKTKSAKSAIADYFAKSGAALPDGALDVPEVTTIAAHRDSPTQWVDRHGAAPPKDAEFYRVDTTSPTADQLIRRKCMPIAHGGEGYTRVPVEAGMRWITMSTEKQVVLMRTKAQKAAFQQARALARHQRMQAAGRKSTTQMGGGAVIESETRMHDQQIVLGGA